MRRLAATAFLLLAGSTLLPRAGPLADRKKHKRDLSDFGTYAVRFQPGTTIEQMSKASRKAAAGTVIADLHQINAMAAASLDASFLDALDATPDRRRASSSTAPRPSPQPARRRAAARRRREIGDSRRVRSVARPVPVGRRSDGRPAPRPRTSGAGVTVALIDTRRGHRPARDEVRAGRPVALHPLRRARRASSARRTVARCSRSTTAAEGRQRPRHLGGEPDRRRAERVRVERHRAGAEDPRPEGARGRLRLRLDLGHLRAARLVRPGRERRQHVAPRVRRPDEPGRRRELPPLGRRRRTTAAARARPSSRRPATTTSASTARS